MITMRAIARGLGIFIGVGLGGMFATMVLVWLLMATLNRFMGGDFWYPVPGLN